MDLKKWIKVFLSLNVILMIAIVIPITFSDDTQSEEHQQELQAAQASLVNFLMHLHENVNDLDEDDLNEELLENFQIEFDLAFIVAQQSNTVATIEYSLGFLKVAYSSLLEDAIENKIDVIEELIDETNAFDETDFTSFSWIVLQEQLGETEKVLEDVLQELDELGISFDDDLNDEESDETLETSVRILEDLTPYLDEIFNELFETHNALVSSHNQLEIAMMPDNIADETEADEIVTDVDDEASDLTNDVDGEPEEQESYCPRNDNECFEALFHATRFEIHNLLLDVNDEVQNIDLSNMNAGLWNELQISIKNAIETLTGDSLEEMIIAHESLEAVLRSLE